MIKRILEKMRNKKAKFQQLQEDDRLGKIVEERKKSANERLLDSMVKKEREEAIKKEIERRTKIEENNYWHKDTMHQKDLFNNPNGNSLLKQQSLFGVGK